LIKRNFGGIFTCQYFCDLTSAHANIGHCCSS
jgi:hypothetical protein